MASTQDLIELMAQAARTNDPQQKAIAQAKAYQISQSLSGRKMTPNEYGKKIQDYTYANTGNPQDKWVDDPYYGQGSYGEVARNAADINAGAWRSGSTLASELGNVTDAVGLTDGAAYTMRANDTHGYDRPTPFDPATNNVAGADFMRGATAIKNLGGFLSPSGDRGQLNDAIQKATMDRIAYTPQQMPRNPD